MEVKINIEDGSELAFLTDNRAVNLRTNLCNGGLEFVKTSSLQVCKIILVFADPYPFLSVFLTKN